MATTSKQSYSYATYPSRKEKAEKKAKKEGVTLSQRIDSFLEEYINDKGGRIYAVYAIDWTEFERGWGQRPDGTTLYKNKSEAESHLKEDAESKKGTDVPECYSSPGKPYLKEVVKELYEKVMSSKGYIWQ